MSHRLGPLSVRSGVVGSMTPLNPFMPTSARQIPRSGPPFAISRDAPVHWAPKQWKAAGLISSPGVVCMAPVDHGKSAIAKGTAVYTCGTRAEWGNPDSPMQRVWVDDSKDHEWSDVTHLIPRYVSDDGVVEEYCEPFSIVDAEMSPLDPRQQPGDQIMVTRLILSQSAKDTGEPVTKYTTMTITAAVEYMIKKEIYPSLHAMAEILNNPPSDFDPPVLHSGTADRVAFADPAEFVRHCRETAMLLHHVLNGPMGRTFGSGKRGSIFDAMDQPMTTIDYHMARPEVKTVVHMLAWLHKKSIMGVDASWFDEAWGLLEDPFFANELRETLKFIRARSQFVGFNLHRPQDLKAITNKDAAEVALGIVKDSAAWIVGRMDHDDALFVQEHWATKAVGCSDQVRLSIESLPPRQFYLFMEGLKAPLHITTVFPTNLLSQLFTNQATERATGKKVL